jgi:hypothetical protein
LLPLLPFGRVRDIRRAQASRRSLLLENSFFVPFVSLRSEVGFGQQPLEALPHRVRYDWLARGDYCLGWSTKHGATVHTVPPYGTDPVCPLPGISCQATLVRSLRDEGQFPYVDAPMASCRIVFPMATSGFVCRCTRERISNVARQPPADRLQHTGQQFLIHQPAPIY